MWNQKIFDYSVAGQVRSDTIGVSERIRRAFSVHVFSSSSKCIMTKRKMYWVRSEMIWDIGYDLKSLKEQRFRLKCCVTFVWPLSKTVALYLSILASSNVTSPFRALIQQGAIPISMVVSWFLFKRSPAWVHRCCCDDYFGYSWIFVANICREESDGLRQRGGYDQYGMGFIFLLSTVFMSLGGCMKEWAMMHPTHPLSMNDVNFWVAFNQLILGVALSPAGFALQKVGTSHRRDVSHLPQNFFDGFKCGVLGIGDIQGNGHDGIDSHGHTGTCGYAAIATYLYV